MVQHCDFLYETHELQRKLGIFFLSGIDKSYQETQQLICSLTSIAGLAVTAQFIFIY